jgi:dimethylamine/trimethylamine dehydrogenase
MPQDPSEYQATLQLFYEEEVIGEAFFAGLANRFPELRAHRAMRLLSAMERCVVDFVRPLLDKYDLRPRGDAELHGMGSLEAEHRATSTWHDYVTSIATSFPVFLEEFAALRRVAPAADLPLLKIFDDHEIAAIEFAKREIAGDPDSLDSLTDFLAAYRPDLLKRQADR